MCSLGIQTWVFQLGQQALYPFIHLPSASRSCLELFLFQVSFNIWSLVCVGLQLPKTTHTSLVYLLSRFFEVAAFCVLWWNTQQRLPKQGRFILSHSLRVQPITAKKVFSRSEAAGYFLSAVRRQGEMNASTHLVVSLFIQSGNQSLGEYYPVWAGVSSSAQPFQKHPHRQSRKWISKAIYIQSRWQWRLPAHSDD